METVVGATPLFQIGIGRADGEERTQGNRGLD